MSIDSSTWLVVVLLIAAASAASYLASEWKVLAHGQRSWGWIGMATGTALLLSAVIALLALIWALEFEIPFVESNDPNVEGRTVTPDPRHAKTAVHEAALVVPRNVDIATKEQHQPRQNTRERSSYEQSLADLDLPIRGGQQSGAAFSASPSSASKRVPISGTTLEPWSATTCVVALQIDPANEALWLIENECPSAVGIVIASCEQSADQCATNAAWHYRSNGMMLPAKWQRAVTQDESTQLGRHIRFVACNLDEEGAQLSATDQGNSTTVWDRGLESAAENDGCSKQVRQWSQAGHRSSRSPDSLFGRRIPLNSHVRDQGMSPTSR